MRQISRTALFAVCLISGFARADDPAPAGGNSEKPAITTAVFAPSGGKEFPYTATAAYMPLKEEAGKTRAKVFYVAYTAGLTPATQPTSQPASQPASQPTSQSATPDTKTPAAKNRPIIFLFNGGPGAASVWLHLGAVGPKKLDIPNDGSAPKAPYKTVDNPHSWLTNADLVFVDPVGTGYSRATDAEKAKEFYGVKEDIDSVGEFIRLYLTKHQRWSSPVYLAGESYGTTRVAGLAAHLQDKIGVSLNGIILISSVLNFATLSPREGNDLPYALYIPTYAALHWYHPQQKIDWDKPTLENYLKDAEKFATNEYTVALAKGDSISEADKKAVAKRLAGFIGLSEAYILQSNLRIPPYRFQKELLRDQEKIIGRFDGRLTASPLDPPNDSADFDPSLSGFYPAYTSAINDYLRTTLKFESDLPYEVLSDKTRPWNFASGGATNAYLYVGDDLKTAMTTNPNLKLLVCSGYYDVATPYFATTYTLNHLGLAKNLQRNITHTFYPGGHMMYHSKDNLELLTKNVASFLEPAK
jgi:carboxypeptidase C (cathepsin A)